MQLLTGHEHGCSYVRKGGIADILGTASSPEQHSRASSYSKAACLQLFPCLTSALWFIADSVL